MADDDGAVEREEDVGGKDEADDDVGEGVAWFLRFSRFLRSRLRES